MLKGALDAGYTFLDTAAVYGLGHNERLVGVVTSMDLVRVLADETVAVPR